VTSRASRASALWNNRSVAWGNDIPTDGCGGVVPWVPLEGRYELAVSVDHLFPRIRWFWEGLITVCDVGCCGIDAFEFNETAIRRAVGVPVDEPNRMAGRFQIEIPEDLKPLVAALDSFLSAVIDLKAPVIRSPDLNQLMDSGMFVELLQHVVRVVSVEADQRVQEL
jgi:Family of unknown function (DUF6331)